MEHLTERSPDGPTLWASTPLWAAALIAATEAATWIFDLWWYIAGVPLSPSAVAGAFAVAALARRGRFGPSAVPVAAMLVFTGYWAASSVEWGTPIALVLAAASEEATYRLALPLLAAAMLRKTGLPRPYPVVAAMLAVAVLFAFLPGHVAQFGTSLFGPVPWIALAVMWTWMLWRGASILVIVTHHAALNCAAFATAYGAPPWLWSFAVVAPIVSWGLLEGIRDRRLGLHKLLVHPPTSGLDAEAAAH